VVTNNLRHAYSGIRPKGIIHGLSVSLMLLLLTGCNASRAPSFLLLNSYFPSWLIGCFIAVPVTLIIRHVLIRTGIDDLLPWRLLVYFCIGLLFTMVFAYYFSPR
jgi:hypothetical protein